jgi:autotransporter translocation and assembly factor TamB
VASLRLELGLAHSGKGFWSLRQVEARQPRLYLRRDGEGRWDLPRLPAGGGGEMQLEALVIEGGVLAVEDRKIAVDGTARGLRVRLTEDPEGRLRGQVKIEGVQIDVPGAPLYEASLLLNAELLGERLKVGDLRLRGESLDLEARGTVRWDPQPGLRPVPTDDPSPAPPELLQNLSAHFQVEAAGDLALLGRLEALQVDIEGPLTTRGAFDWSLGGWRYAGGLESPAFELWERPVADARGTIEWRDRQLLLRLEEASLAGGRGSGTLALDLTSPRQPLEIDLRLVELDADRALRLIGLPALHLSGLATGDLNLRSVRGARAAVNGWGSFSLQPVDTEDALGLAVTGDVPLTFEAGTVSSTALFLSSERQRVLAAGEYDLVGQRGRFDFHLDTEDSGQITALIEEQLELTETPTWLPHQGHGTVTGALLLEPGASIPTWDLHLDLQQAATPAVTADRGHGNLRVHEGGVDRIRLELETRDGAVLITGASRVPPEGEAVTELAFDTVDWPLENVPLWESWGIPIDGTVTGRMLLDGPADALEGSLHGTLAPVRFEGRDLGRLEMALAWDPREVRVERGVLHGADGTVTVEGSVALGDGALDLRLAGRQLRLEAEPLGALAQHRLAGVLEFEGRLEGTPAAPRARLEAATRDVTVLGRSLASTRSPQRLTVQVDGEDIRLEGSLLGLLAVKGRGRRTAAPAGEQLEFTATVESETVGALAELASGEPQPQMDGAFGGHLSLTGPWTRPDQMQWGLALESLEGTYAGHRVALAAPGSVEGQGERVILEGITLEEAATGSRLTLDGAAGSELALGVRGHVDTSWGRLAWPDLDLPGTVTVAGRLVGTPARPAFDGEARVRLQPFPLPFAPQTVEDVTATLRLSPQTIALETLTATVGGGTVQAWGQMELTPEGSLEGYRLYGRATRVKLLYPEGWLQRGDAELYLTSLSDGREIRGTVDLDEVRYLAQFDLGVAQALRKLLEPERLEVGPTDELLTETRLNIAIKAPGAVRLRNELVNLRGSLDLELRGDLARPILLGKAEVDTGGTVRYAGNDYEVERGSLDFTNPYRVDPEIDLVARGRLRAYEVTLNVTGTPERLDVDVASDPPLPRLDVLSLITSGRPPNPDTVPARPGTREGEYTAETFLFGEAASALTERVNTLFGFDKFRIDPLSEGNEAVSSVRFTVGKRLSKDWFVTYSRDPSTTEGDILEAEWQISRQLVLVFTQNGDGSFSVDALWDRQF